MHPWHYRATAYPPIGGLFILLPTAVPDFCASACPLAPFAVPSCPVSTSPCVVRLRAGRFPWNPWNVSGARSGDPWRGQGLCREITAVPRASLAYFVSIFCPRIAGCCA